MEVMQAPWAGVRRPLLLGCVRDCEADRGGGEGGAGREGSLN